MVCGLPQLNFHLDTFRTVVDSPQLPQLAGKELEVKVHVMFSTMMGQARAFLHLLSLAGHSAARAKADCMTISEIRRYPRIVCHIYLINALFHDGNQGPPYGQAFGCHGNATLPVMLGCSPQRKEKESKMHPVTLVGGLTGYIGRRCSGCA